MDILSFLTGFAAGTLSVLVAAVLVAVFSPRPAKVLPRREESEPLPKRKTRTMWD